MMKKIYIGIFVAAGMLLAAACSNDNLEAPGNETAAQSGEEVTVSFSLSLDDEAQTRAISDGSKLDQLVYVIYDSNGNIITKDADGNAGPATAAYSASLDVNLVNNQTYTAIFWAQNSGCSDDYTITASGGTMTVGVSYTGASNNDDTRDAFYGSAQSFTVSGSGTQGVKMKRPFAQINVGATESDWNAAVAAGVTITHSSVTIKNVGNSINLLTGSVSGSDSATFTSAAIPGVQNSDDTYLTPDGSTDTYYCLSMSYVLIPDGQTTLDALDFTFSTGETASATDITLNLTDVAVSANYRTNILGSFLSSSIQHVSSEDDLATAVANGGIITLDADISLGDPLSIAKDVTIYLNGKTLTTSERDSDYGDLIVYDDATLTIQDGTIIQEDYTRLICETGGAIVLDNVTYSGTEYSCIFNNNNAKDTQITVRNSTVTGGFYAVSTYANANTSSDEVGYTTMTLENSKFIANETALCINTPSTLTATDCTFQGGWQAAFLRGGTSEFTDCAFNLVLDPTYNDVPEVNNNADGTWGDENLGVIAALLIGNRCADNASAYNYPTTVTLSNCEFSVTGTAYDNRTADQTPSVYIWSRVETGNGTTITYDADSYTSFEDAGSGSYVGNSGTNLTVNGSAYSTYTVTDTKLPAVQ